VRKVRNDDATASSPLPAAEVGMRHEENTTAATCLSDEFPGEFRAWVNVLAKCYDPRHPEYASEGGVGVKVCEAWRESFSAFFADMGPMPESDD
jgi:hypothetical protein